MTQCGNERKKKRYLAKGIQSTLIGASLRSEKACQNIDISREFIEKFSLFWDRRKALTIIIRDIGPRSYHHVYQDIRPHTIMVYKRYK